MPCCEAILGQIGKSQGKSSTGPARMSTPRFNEKTRRADTPGCGHALRMQGAWENRNFHQTRHQCDDPGIKYNDDRIRVRATMSVGESVGTGAHRVQGTLHTDPRRGRTPAGRRDGAPTSEPNIHSRTDGSSNGQNSSRRRESAMQRGDQMRMTCATNKNTEQKVDVQLVICNRVAAMALLLPEGTRRHT